MNRKKTIKKQKEIINRMKIVRIKQSIVIEVLEKTLNKKKDA